MNWESSVLLLSFPICIYWNNGVQIVKNSVFLPILCSGEHRGWNREVRSKIQDFNIGALQSVCILAVRDTAASENFRRATTRLSPEYTMIIGDEVHGLGSPKMQQAFLSQATMRLGLSATPKRWFDDTGTDAIFSYFGQICFELPLEKAIGTYLTPYSYHPVLVHLSEQEMEEYGALSQSFCRTKIAHIA